MQRLHHPFRPTRAFISPDSGVEQPPVNGHTESVALCGSIAFAASALLKRVYVKGIHHGFLE
jgi:hypothetical protein